MKKLNPRTRQAIATKEDDLVQQAREVAKALWESLHEKEQKGGKVRQLRNILEVAESTDSWKALALFIRYQAARTTDNIPRDWAEYLIDEMESLTDTANEIAKQTHDDPKTIHLEMVTRVLGHAVRWHLWDVKKGEG